MSASSYLFALGHVARHYGLPVASQSAHRADALAETLTGEAQITLLAKRHGLRLRTHAPERMALSAWHLPLICAFHDGTVGVMVSYSKRGGAAVLFEGEAAPVQLAPEVLAASAASYQTARPVRTLADDRVDSYIAPYREGWLRRIALPDLRPYGHVLIASLTANILALSGIIFSQQVYDRVVPAQSFNTLYVLFAGVLLAAGFDFVLRRMRTQITDTLGKGADLRLSDHVFGHAIRVKTSARPRSTSAFVAQLRDLEQLREVLTSTTVTVLADLPFFFLFLAVFWYIGGPLVAVPIAAVIAMILPGLLMQRRLGRALNEAMREGAMRNALMIEVAQGVDDIKALQAEDRFQQRWNHFNAVTAAAQIQQRRITSGLQTWSQTVQTLVYAAIVFVGAPMVINGDVTSGTLVACSILGSRMMAPMGQVSQIFSRLQQARLSFQSVDSLMRLAVDHPPNETRISCAALEGSYEFRAAKYAHDSARAVPALTLPHLTIRAGEKIAVLGQIGAGKSTLLQAMAGFIEPTEGEVLLDRMALARIDPADLRRDMGILTQDSRLFHGSLRDNLTLGAPQATDAEMLAALDRAGAADFVSRMAEGLDYQLQENGRGVSGGQRQALMLARLFLRDPKIVLLDEPTAAMDEQSERQLIDTLGKWGAGKTMVVATHRMRLLDIVDRVLVLDRGGLAFDGSKEAFLAKLNPAPPQTKAPSLTLASSIQRRTSGAKPSPAKTAEVARTAGVRPTGVLPADGNRKEVI